MEKYLITGGAGFIGSNLAQELVQRGHQVRVVDNFLTGKKENIAFLLDKIELIEGDIRDFKICQQALAGVDFVLHQAALPSVPRSIEDPLLTSEININGTLNLLWASKEVSLKKFVFASSSSVYGDDPSLPKHEDMKPNPLSPYALTKLVGEFYCQIFSQIYRLPTISLRYFNVFGPRQSLSNPYTGVVAIFMSRIKNNNPPIVYEDGLQTRDFISVYDVVNANLLAMEKNSGNYQVFNVGSGNPITIKSIAETIAKLYGKNIKPNISGKFRKWDIRHCYADISKIRDKLEFEVKTSFEEDLKELISWSAKKKATDKFDIATKELEERGLI